MTDEIAFTTVGGRQRAAVDSPAEAPRGVVVVAPALGVRASYYRKLCGALNGLGFMTSAVDLPGHGESPARANRRTDWGYGSVIEHYASALRALNDAMPELPKFMHCSLGPDRPRSAFVWRATHGHPNAPSS